MNHLGTPGKDMSRTMEITKKKSGTDKVRRITERNQDGKKIKGHWKYAAKDK